MDYWGLQAGDLKCGVLGGGECEPTLQLVVKYGRYELLHHRISEHRRDDVCPK